MPCVQADEFDERELFRAIGLSGARVLVIGRRAMIALGVPVLTSDIDLWVHINDIEKLNDALRSLDLFPTHDVAAARARGRYVLEGDIRVDVLVARSQSTKDGSRLSFDECWERRREQPYEDGVPLVVPTIADLITTKRWSMRVKDVADIQLLESLRKEEEGE
jgi:hypothetical protein